MLFRACGQSMSDPELLSAEFEALSRASLGTSGVRPLDSALSSLLTTPRSTPMDSARSTRSNSYLDNSYSPNLPARFSPQGDGTRSPQPSRHVAAFSEYPLEGDSVFFWGGGSEISHLAVEDSHLSNHFSRREGDLW